MPKGTAPWGFLLSIFLLFMFPLIAKAYVVINEFSSASNPEWVEIYNSDASEISLNGWALFFQDNAETTQKCYFGDNDLIAGGGFKTIERGYSGTQAWLRDDGDTIILKDSGGLTVNIVRYGDVSEAVIGDPNENESAGRNPQGSDNWLIGIPTKEVSQICVSSTPTPIPTSTSTQTYTPNPTPTPTPSKTPVPTPTKTPSPKPSQVVSGGNNISENSDTEVDVLGLRNQLASEEPTPNTETSKNKSSVLPIILIIFGAGLMGFAGYTLFKKMKTEGYNNESGQNL